MRFYLILVPVEIRFYLECLGFPIYVKFRIIIKMYLLKNYLVYHVDFHSLTFYVGILLALFILDIEKHKVLRYSFYLLYISVICQEPLLYISKYLLTHNYLIKFNSVFGIRYGEAWQSLSFIESSPILWQYPFCSR